MRNLDSGPAGFGISKKAETIEPMAANAAQQLIIEKMIPESLWVYMTETGGGLEVAMDEFYTIWIEKYAYLFREYCNTQMDDQDFLDRIESENLNAEDIAEIVDFITKKGIDDEGNEVGGEFFDENAIESFRSSVTH
jgi:hypothetical protein